MIRNIVFDIGNVLVDFRWAELLKDYGATADDVAAIGERAFATGMWSQLDLGVRDENEVIEEIAESLGDIRGKFMMIFEHADELVRPFPGNREWIGRLKADGYRIFLLSNYPAELFRIHAEKCFDFMDLIDGKVVSAYEKMIKPDERIYRLLLSRYGLDPEETVYLDDLPANAEAARRVGMRAVTVVNRDQAISGLESIINEDRGSSAAGPEKD